MAEMIPEYAVQASDTTEKTYQKLSRMLGNGYKVVQYLNTDSLIFNQADKNKKIRQSQQTGTGSLFWIQKSQQSLFFYISNTSDNAVNINKTQQEIVRHELSNNVEIKNILKLQYHLLPKGLHPHKAKLAPFLIFFPDCNNNKIKIGIKSHGLFLHGKESLEPAKLLTLLRTHMGMGTSPTVINHIRRVFNPELIMSNQNKTLLDEDQEFALKSELALPIDARRADNYNLRVLNGVAGSGKTQVLIHRAHLIRTLFPMQKVLILCHNNAINQSINAQYKRLNPNDRKITISPFLDWCRKRLNISQEIVFENDIDTMINSVIKRQLKNNNGIDNNNIDNGDINKLTKSTLLREISFIKDRLIFTESDYLDFKRPKQADSILDENQKKRIWKTLLALNYELSANNNLLWRDIPRLLLQSTEEGKLLEHYDHILVDEAQYFAPLHYTLIKKSLKPHSGQLYITFDENQGFLNNRIHIKDTGLNLRGHSMRLLQSYRVNPLIMRAAHAFHLNRLPEESDDIFSNSGAKHHQDQTADDVIPELLHFQSEQNEETRLLKEIHNLIKEGVAEKDILILTTDMNVAHPLTSTIRKNLGLSVDLPTLTNSDPNALHICPLDYATGLESPIVFILGIQHLFTNEHHSENKIEQHSRRIENTRKLYMGMTRASQQLTLMMVTDEIPEAFITPHIKNPTLIANSDQHETDIRYLH